MAEKETAEEEVAVPAKKSGGKMMPIMIIMNTLLIAGVLVFVMKRPSAPAVAAAGAPAKEGGEHGAAAPEGHGKEGVGVPGPTLKLENFIIQLRTAEAERYVRVAFDVELNAETDRDPVVLRMSQLRDSVISYFADRTLEELRGSDGMDHIKTALLKRLDELIPGHRMKAIFITEFIVQ
jgi:flagellar FliL protein